MLASTASAPRVTRCSLGLYWSHDLCSKHALADWGMSSHLGQIVRNLMTQDQCPLPVYYSQPPLRMDTACSHLSLPAITYTTPGKSGSSSDPSCFLSSRLKSYKPPNRRVPGWVTATCGERRQL